MTLLLTGDEAAEELRVSRDTIWRMCKAGDLALVRVGPGRSRRITEVNVKTMTLDEFKAAIKAQGLPIERALFRCPHCGTAQCANDLIEAGAGKDLDEVEKYLAFSCVGRWNMTKGCNWTLGGLFQIHDVEVVTPDGERHPRFEPLTPEEI